MPTVARKPMNIHHLELFYYVARYGGITEAVRNMPYGIQQPAISGQVAQLEEHLGVTLFHRRPFALTPAGEKLYQFIQPFFANLGALETELQGGQAQHIRIGASTIVLRDHLPDLIQHARKKLPQLRVALREGYQGELESLLLREEIDLAVTLIEKRATPGINSQVLLELPMMLLVPASSKITNAEQLWEQDPINEALICMPAAEVITKHLQQTRDAPDFDPAAPPRPTADPAGGLRLTPRPGTRAGTGPRARCRGTAPPACPPRARCTAARGTPPASVP